MKKPLILWGGTDIDSSYYGKKASSFAQTPNRNRDKSEFRQVYAAIEDKIPIIGICRGAQILCAVNGGTLIQHSQPIKQNHPIKTYDGETIYDAPGCHHQIMVPKGNFKLLAVNPGPTKVWHTDEAWEIELDCPEVVWWPEHNHFGIQAHPEWAKEPSPFLRWIHKELKRVGIDYSFSEEEWV